MIWWVPYFQKSMCMVRNRNSEKALFHGSCVVCNYCLFSIQDQGLFVFFPNSKTLLWGL